MTVSDPMPKDKRTRAYKDWLKREKQRQRMKELEGAVSLRGFTYQDKDANEKYASLSMMLAELRYKLLMDNSTAIKISEGRLDASGYTRNALAIRPNSKYVLDFKNWVFQNQFSNSGYYQNYPYLYDNQIKLLEEGKTIPKTNQYGQPTRPEGNLGIAGQQCSWKVIGDNHYTRLRPYQRDSRNEKIEGGDERSNRWQPIIPGALNSSGRNMGLFPPTFWPRDLGDIPKDDDEIMMAMIDWLDNLIEIYWSTPQYGTTPRVGIAWRDEHRKKYYQGNPAYEGTGLSTLEEIRNNEEARAWLEDASLGILLSFLRNMTITNTFYQEVYDEVLSADAEWVVLLTPAMSSTDEYNAPRGPNLVMPFTTWIDKAMAHENWYRCSYVTIDGERVEVTREMLLEQGLEIYEQVTNQTYQSSRQGRNGPMEYDSLGILTLAMNETVSFQNLIDPSIFQEALSAYTEIWRNSQKERVAKLKNENETKTEETTAWLEKTRQELADAEVKSYVQFTQQKGPRGGIYDGRAVQFIMQLKPNVDWRDAPPRYTEAQEQDYLNLQREVYQKFVEAAIPQSPEDVTFIDITRKIPYSEAVKIKGETRSYGSKYKYPALERAMGGRSISEQFMRTQETTLTALLSQFRGMSKEDKAGLMRIVPTTVKDIRSDRALKQSVKQMTSQLGKVRQAQRALDRAQSYFNDLAKTVTKKQRKALQAAYLASVKRGSRKSGEPTVELLKALGIPVPKED